MRIDLIEMLEWPECHGRLSLEGNEVAGDPVQSGSLICRECLKGYPIRQGIPRFTPDDSSYAVNFGWQWQRFRETQIDRLNGTKESEHRFQNETGWMSEDVRGRLVLDAGCGAGRFSTIAAEWGARIVSMDLAGPATEACAENLAQLGLSGDVIQASIYSPPFRPGTFDAVFSLGVLQHTPDPSAAMKRLPGLLKPGGKLVYWIYEKRWYQPLLVRNALRLLTRYWSSKTNWRLTRGRVAIFFPVALAMSVIPGLKKLLPMLPISARMAWGTLSLGQAWEWTLLDTFDSYSARYEYNQDEADVRTALGESGMLDVRRTPARGMAIVAQKPVEVVKVRPGSAMTASTGTDPHPLLPPGKGEGVGS